MLTEALGINISACAPFIIPIIEEKLPGKARSYIGDCGRDVNFDLQSFISSFKDYITKEEQSQAVNTSLPQTITRPPSQYETYESHVTSTLTATVSTTCQLCKGPHTTPHCTIPANDRTAIVLRDKLCLNCLRPGHRVVNCNARGRCAKCKVKHHTSIHGIRIYANVSTTSSPRNTPTTRQPPSSTNTHAAIITNDTFTATPVTATVPTADPSSQLITSNCAPVYHFKPVDMLNDSHLSPSTPISDKLPNVVLNSAGVTKTDDNSYNANHNTILLKTAKALAVVKDTKLSANIFFDEGSQRSYIRTEFANQLGLTPDSYELLSVSGFGGSVTKHNYGVSTVGLETLSGVESVKVLMSDEIVKPLNHTGCSDLKNYPRLQELQLANDFLEDHFAVDILLGADAAYRFLGAVDDRYPEPFVQNSKFGYLISGPISQPISATSDAIAISHETNVVNANPAESNDALINEPNHTPTDESPTISMENLVDNAELFIQFERLFHSQSATCDSANNHEDSEFLHDYRQKIDFRDGQYFAPLPWKTDHPPLPSNLNLCKSRLSQVTSRLHKLGLMDNYCKVMAEHLAKGYIEELPNLNKPWPEQGCHYLPHFFVLKNSETTPLRIVFAANSGQVSLNDCLYTGPCLLNNLVALLLRFRFPRYAFVADIQRAFLHIKLREEDRPFVRFLWYKDNDPIKAVCVYTYTTIVFGHTSSPMSLGAVLLKHLQQFSSPVAVDISEKLYVDNLLSGVENEADAISYFHEARDLMQQGNFILRQWCTNSPLLQAVVDEHHTGTQSATVSVLGLPWNSHADTISFPKQNFDSTHLKLTKRKVLSMACKLYDPLGMLLPVTIVARLFIAELWEEKFGWDQPLPPSKLAIWQKIERDFNAASHLEFPRWLNFDPNQPVSLHIFSDASKYALGATAYLTQGTSSFLLGSKSKLVSRSKNHLTIPQLELSAMFLGSQYCDNLLNIVRKDFPRVSVHLWSDSEIALFWLGSTRQLKQFVHNKVDAINRKFDSSFWAHTPSQDNPADLVSRGCSTKSLTTSTLWQRGPSWLCNKSFWPQWPKTQVTSATVLTAVTEQQLPAPDTSICNIIDIDNFNKYSRLLATSVYVYRFCYRTGIKGPPTTPEIEIVERAWLQSEQQHHYPQVVSHLSSDAQCDHTSIPPIARQLNLFLGDDGLLRTKGRFTLDSSLILLPRHSRLTNLIILDCHHRMFHVGVGGTIVALRTRFWLPSARSEARRLLSKCVRCKRVTGRHYLLPMSSELPPFRYDTSIRPFSNVGVDFTGHLTVKNRSGDHVKFYVCLFTCLATTAISLEIVEDLRTSSFLLAFRRHCSVFSTPRLLLSDNAQTFKRADQDLQTLLSHFDSPSVQNALTQKRIRFLYIPARSPHWGGVYERLIGLTKTSLKKILGRSLITLAEMCTLIKEIQAILNDRPLTSLNSDIHDLQPLTPNHLLFGFNVTSLPHPPLDSVDYDPTFGDANDISRAQHHRTTLYTHFLQRFQREYLTLLRETHVYQSKKQQASHNIIRIGDVVLVADTDMPKHRWPLAVVETLIHGSDNLCRAAVVRTANGHTTRSLIKLYPLELNICTDAVTEDPTANTEAPSAGTTRPLRCAARAPRDIIHAQLIDMQQD